MMMMMMVGQYEELLIGAAHAKARLALQKARLAEAELKAHQTRAAALLALAKVLVYEV